MTSHDFADLERHRRAKDAFFGASTHSPLPTEARAGFAGLRYYEPDPALAFRPTVEPVDGGSITVPTSDGRERRYRRAGRVNFDVAGTTASLTLYDTGQPGYFVPFRDATSGTETYGAGRYLDLEANDDGTVTLDFNLAYNPFCAYNDMYSCPLPPVENWLAVPIRAGERSYERP